MFPLNLRTLAPYLPQLLDGLWLTFAISAVSVAIELPLGLGGALLRTSRFPLARSLVAGYVQVLRNVPLLIVLFALFYVLPEFGVTLSPFTAGVLGLSLNGSAYAIEIFRGGLAGIATGQREVASSLGLRPHQVFSYVVFPQLLRISFPALGNQVVGTTLVSSQAFFIGVAELTTVSNNIGSITYAYFEIYLIAGVLYVAAAQVLNRAWTLLGRRLVGGDSGRGQ